ncbi:MAG: hypothetical protein ABI323_11535 [Solirubrobacteraceae bacterium]
MKAVACELPARYGLPLGRFSRTALYRLVIELAVTDASASTIWRWLHDDAIKPWQQQSWIYRRDPQFGPKAGRGLDLYARGFDGKRLRPDEYMISTDEKSQLQALGRRHLTDAPGPGRPSRHEFEYKRGGTLAYLTAWDVHHANLFDRVEKTTGIASRPGSNRSGASRSWEDRAVHLGEDGVVDRGQRLQPCGEDVDQADAGPLAQRRLIHLPSTPRG